MNNKRLLALFGTGVVLVLIFLVYWPVHSAEFIWDDAACLNDAAALRHGDSWTTFIFHGFCEWTNYFRPLVVGFFAGEVRVFDVRPGPMHVISLCWHLANTLLVGLLANAMSGRHESRSKTPLIAPWMVMLVYGLHPALIEPVAWIGSRFDLVVTFWMILGLLLNTVLRHPAVRAFAVAACFFLAANSKEEAISFPLVLVLFDWLRADRAGHGPRGVIKELWGRQFAVYLSVLVAGLIYLGLRYWAMGHLVQAHEEQPLFSLQRWQSVSHTYLIYWQLIVWPMVGLSPMHIVDKQQFAVITLNNFASDFAAMTIFILGIYQWWKHKPLGCLILAVSVSLLPVLGIFPIDFIPDLYHERYAMPAIAWCCVLLPRTLGSVTPSRSFSRVLPASGALVAIAWLALATMNVRATLPLWSEDRKLWLWALQSNPGSQDAMSNLLSAYMLHNDIHLANQVADHLMTLSHPCALCMINVASLAAEEGDTARVSAALAKAKEVMAAENPPAMVVLYIQATGKLREMQGDLQGAEEAYRDAIAMKPMDPKARTNLALLLAREGKEEEARREITYSLQLLPPDLREPARSAFDRTLRRQGPSSQSQKE